MGEEFNFEELLNDVKQGKYAGNIRSTVRQEPMSGVPEYEPLNKYDKGLRLGVNQQDYRARNQGTGKKWMNALGQLATTVVGDTVSGFGYLFELIDGVDNLETDSHNMLVQLGESLSETGREDLFPIYGTRKNLENFSPFTADWWTTNIPSIGSALSLFIPARAVSGGLGMLGRAAGKAGKLVGKTKRGAATLNKMKELGIDVSKMQGAQKFGSALTQSFVSRHMENMMEASGTYESTYQEALTRGMSEEEARAAAGEAASQNYRDGYWAMLTDLPQYLALVGIKPIKINALADIGYQAGIESFEEAFQFAIGKRAEKSVFDENYSNTILGELVDNLDDPELQTSAFFGAFGGAVFDLGGKAINRGLETLMKSNNPQVTSALQFSSAVIDNEDERARIQAIAEDADLPEITRFTAKTILDSVDEVLSATEGMDISEELRDGLIKDKIIRKNVGFVAKKGFEALKDLMEKDADNYLSKVLQDKLEEKDLPDPIKNILKANFAVPEGFTIDEAGLPGEAKGIAEAVADSILGMMEDYKNVRQPARQQTGTTDNLTPEQRERLERDAVRPDETEVGQTGISADEEAATKDIQEDLTQISVARKQYKERTTEELESLLQEIEESDDYSLTQRYSDEQAFAKRIIEEELAERASESRTTDPIIEEDDEDMNWDNIPVEEVEYDPDEAERERLLKEEIKGKMEAAPDQTKENYQKGLNYIDKNKDNPNELQTFYDSLRSKKAGQFAKVADGEITQEQHDDLVRKLNTRLEELGQKEDKEVPVEAPISSLYVKNYPDKQGRIYVRDAKSNEFGAVIEVQGDEIKLTPYGISSLADLKSFSSFLKTNNLTKEEIMSEVKTGNVVIVPGKLGPLNKSDMSREIITPMSAMTSTDYDRLVAGQVSENETEVGEVEDWGDLPPDIQTGTGTINFGEDLSGDTSHYEKMVGLLPNSSEEQLSFFKRNLEKEINNRSQGKKPDFQFRLSDTELKNLLGLVEQRISSLSKTNKTSKTEIADKVRRSGLYRRDTSNKESFFKRMVERLDKLRLAKTMDSVIEKLIASGVSAEDIAAELASRGYYIGDGNAFAWGTRDYLEERVKGNAPTLTEIFTGNQEGTTETEVENWGDLPDDIQTGLDPEQQNSLNDEREKANKGEESGNDPNESTFFTSAKPTSKRRMIQKSKEADNSNEAYFVIRGGNRYEPTELGIQHILQDNNADDYVDFGGRTREQVAQGLEEGSLEVVPATVVERAKTFRLEDKISFRDVAQQVETPQQEFDTRMMNGDYEVMNEMSDMIDDLVDRKGVIIPTLIKNLKKGVIRYNPNIRTFERVEPAKPTKVDEDVTTVVTSTPTDESDFIEPDLSEDSEYSLSQNKYANRGHIPEVVVYRYDEEKGFLIGNVPIIKESRFNDPTKYRMSSSNTAWTQLRERGSGKTVEGFDESRLDYDDLRKTAFNPGDEVQFAVLDDPYNRGEVTGSVPTWEDITIYGVVNGKPLFKVPQYTDIIEENKEMLEALRKEAFRAWTASGGQDVNLPFYTRLTSIKPPQWKRSAKRTWNYTPDQKLMINIDGSSLVNGVGEEFALNKDVPNGKGNVYRLITTPNGYTIPVRTDIKPISQDVEFPMQYIDILLPRTGTFLKDKLLAMAKGGKVHYYHVLQALAQYPLMVDFNADQASRLRSDIRGIVRWNETYQSGKKKTVKLEPDFNEKLIDPTKNNKFMSKDADGNNVFDPKKFFKFLAFQDYNVRNSTKRRPLQLNIKDSSGKGFAIGNPLYDQAIAHRLVDDLHTDLITAPGAVTFDPQIIGLNATEKVDPEVPPLEPEDPVMKKKKEWDQFFGKDNDADLPSYRMKQDSKPQAVRRKKAKPEVLVDLKKELREFRRIAGRRMPTQVFDLIDSGRAWAVFKGNVVAFQEGPIAEGTGRHEAFHAIFRTALTERQQEALLKEYRAMYPNVKSDYALEEYMADDLMDYKAGVKKKGLVAAVKRIFRYLRDLIDIALNRPMESQRIFDLIDRGMFAHKVKPIPEIAGGVRRPKGMTTYMLNQAIDGIMPYFVKVAGKQYLQNIKKENRDKFEEALDKGGISAANKLLNEYITGTSVDDYIKYYFREYLQDNSALVNAIEGQLGEDSPILPFLKDRSLDPYLFRGFAKYGLQLRGSRRLVNAAYGYNEEDMSEIYDKDVDDRESWQLEVGQISLKESIPARLRRFFASVPVIDGDGFIRENYWGLPMYHDPGVVFNTVLDAIGNSTSVENMLHRIDAMPHSDIKETLIKHLPAIKTQLWVGVAQNVRPLYLTIVGSKAKYTAKSSDYLNVINMVNSSIDINNEKQEHISAKEKHSVTSFYKKLLDNGFYFMENAIYDLHQNKKDWDFVRKRLDVFTSGENAYNFNDSNKPLQDIVKVVAKYYPKESQPAFYGVEGERRYSWIRANYAARTIAKLNTWGSEFRQQAMYASEGTLNDKIEGFIASKVGGDPLLTNSKVLQSLLGGLKMDFAIIEGIKRETSKTGTKYTNMSVKDMLMSLLSAYDDNAFTLPIFSDSPTLGAVKFSNLGRGQKLFGDLKESVDLLKNLKKAEEDRIKYLENLAKKDPEVKRLLSEMKSFKDRWNRTFFMPNNVEGFVVKQAADLRKLALDTGIIETNKEGDYYLKTNPTISATEKEFKSKDPDNIDRYLAEYVAKDLLVRSEMAHVLLGNPAFYKNPGDFYKRAKEIWSPGTHVDTQVLKNQTGFYNVGIKKTKEKDKNSNSFNILKTALEGYPEILDNVSSEIDVTDGQSYIDLFSYMERLRGLGRLNREQEIAYELIMQGKSPMTANLDQYPKDLQEKVRKVVLQPLKPFYFAHSNVSNKEFTHPVQQKDSEMLIIPRLADPKFPLYNPEYKEMMEGMGYTFSGEGQDFKVTFDEEGRIKGDYIDKWGYDSTIKVGLNGIDEGKTKHKFRWDEWKLQVETPEHHINTDSKLGSQIVKLITADLEKDDPRINQFITKIIEDIAYDEGQIYKEFEDAQGNFDRNAFLNMLRDEIVRMNLGNHYYEALETNALGETAIPLSLPIHEGRITSMVTSIFRDAITNRKVKRNGVSFINASAQGFEEQPQIKQDPKTGEFYYEAFAAPWDRRFYQEKYLDENGFPSVQKVIDEGDQELLKGVVYRIPTEDKYSMFNVRVTQFIPPEMGGAIILPEEITKIAGLDFDIDKVYGFFKTDLENLTFNSKELRDVYKRRKPELNELYKEKSEIYYEQQEYFNELNASRVDKEKASDLYQEIELEIAKISDYNAELEEELERILPTEENERSVALDDVRVEEVLDIIKYNNEYLEELHAKKYEIITFHADIKKTTPNRAQIDAYVKKVHRRWDSLDKKIQQIRKEIEEEQAPIKRAFKERVKSDNDKIDLIYNIIGTNPQMSFNPGNFDTIKSNNFEIRFWTNRPRRINKNGTQGKAYSWNAFSALSDREKEEILDSQDRVGYNGPVDQINIARRMNVGKILIGIAANNNAAHSIFQRYQILSKESFYFNGKAYNDFSGIYEDSSISETSPVEKALKTLNNYGFTINQSKDLMIDIASKRVNIDLNNPTHIANALSSILSKSLSYSDYFKDLKNELYDSSEFKKRYNSYLKEFPDYTENKVANIAMESIFKDLLENGFSNELVRKMNLSEKVIARLKKFINDITSLFKDVELNNVNSIINDIVKKTFEGEEFISLEKKKNYSKLDFQDAFDRDPKAKEIMTRIGTNPALVLTGSIAYAPQGTIYRDKNKAIHDIDFRVIKDDFDVSTFVKNNFPNARVVNDFKENGKRTLTYSIPAEDLGIEVQEPTGKLTKEEFEKALSDQAILVDFFQTSKSEREYVNHTFTGSDGKQHNVKLANYQSGFDAKLRISREKDIWDLLNFKPNNFKKFNADKRKRITENISEMLAAFVDNGKDPQADYFNMNGFTADVAMAMLHAGIPLRTVQLYLSHPSIRKFTRDYFNNGENLDLTLGKYKFVLPSIKDYQFDKTLDDKTLLDAIKNKDTDNNKVIQDFLMYQKYIAGPLGQVVSLSKQGDVGAGPTLVDMATQYHRRNTHLKKNPNKMSLMGTHAMLTDMNNNYLNVLYQKGMKDVAKYIGENMDLPDLSTGKIDFLSKHISDNFKDGEPLSNNEIKLLFEAYNRFIATKSSLYTAEKFEDLYRDMPDRLTEAKKKYPNNYFLQRLTYNEETGVIEFTGVIGSDRDEIDRMRSHFGDLFKQDSSRKLATDLASYAFYGSGFKTSLRGFGAFVPLDLYTNTAEGLEYIKIFKNELRDMHNIYSSANPEMLNFVSQFITANFTQLSFIPTVDRKDVEFGGARLKTPYTEHSPKYKKYYVYNKFGLQDINLYEGQGDKYVRVDKDAIGVWKKGNPILLKYDAKNPERKAVSKKSEPTEVESLENRAVYIASVFPQLESISGLPTKDWVMKALKDPNFTENEIIETIKKCHNG